MSILVKVNDQVDNIDIDSKELEKIFDRAKKPHVRLENWAWYRNCLTGDAVNHPVFGNRFIKTSSVVFIDESTGVAETRNTVYVLGAKVEK